MLTVALPNKGSLADGVTAMLVEAGYRSRPEGRDLTVVDPANGVRFYFLRPRDVAVYVGSGDIDLGITGRDMALDSGAPVTEALALGIGRSSFRYAAPDTGADWTVGELAGKRIATSYPRLVADDLARRGIEAEVVRLDGAVEISVELGVADAIADVVSTGRTLAAHGLVAFGETLCTSEAVVIQRSPDAGGPSTDDGHEASRRQVLRRLEGVAVAQQYVMVDYDCPRDLLEPAVALTPGLESPTVAPLRDDAWVAVRALVPKAEMNDVIDALADLGAKAILASDLRSARL
ncbi:ATP phosphoribosyltransferase [Iamia sp.]|uniref:ATP phosphoribosyltransferase n=1 Tax=Iamia sp. TaxID=2722710 RepID=UPI002C91FB44|nr:ATP phosphoribosyltransferase [Iamia sp.]HXH58244.1 ATP phosphoribosyltransferase [Iamia sp.]